VGSIDPIHGSAGGVEPDVKLTQVGLIAPDCRWPMSGFQQIEETLRLRRQWKVGARPSAARLETEEVVRVKPVEVLQGEATLLGTDAIRIRHSRESLQELVELDLVELPDRSTGRLEPEVELSNDNTGGWFDPQELRRERSQRETRASHCRTHRR
jgi:hypothetical protein